MGSRRRCLVVALIAAIVGLLISPSASSALTPTPDQDVSAWVYDAEVQSPAPAGGAPEPGPPAARHTYTTDDAVDRWSRGASVYPDGPTPAAVSGYDHPTAVAQDARATGTTQALARVTNRDAVGYTRAGVAAKSADEFVDLASASRRSHILDGHRYGGEAGNTWFPKGWSDGKIMQSVSDIATDPSLTWVQQTGRAGAAYTRGGAPVRYTVEGVRDGVKIRVVLEPGGEGIITGFPIP